MDQQANILPDMISNYKLDDEIFLPSYDESPTLLNGGFKFRDYPLELNLLDSAFSPDPGPGLGFIPGNNIPISSTNSSEVGSPDDMDSDPVLRYLNQILLEANMEEKPSMFPDPLALLAAEESFHNVLGEYNTLPSSYQHDQNAGSPDSPFGVSSEYSTNSSNNISCSIDPGEHRSPSIWQSNSDSFQSSSQMNPNNMPLDSPGSLGSILNNGRQMDSLAFNNKIPNIYSDSESISQFQKGMEEARKFLPTGNLSFNLDKYAFPPKNSDEFSRWDSQVKIERGENEESSSGGGFKGKKHLHRQESDLVEQRSSKQPAFYVEEDELSEMFDKVLLEEEEDHKDMDSMRPQQRLVSNGSSYRKAARARNRGSSQTEAVDLRTLLISCAQSVAADNRRTASEQLKQIRQHSSSTGDAYQRLAWIFANGLEARMVGTGTEVHTSLASKRLSAAEMLKAYQVYLVACPFKKTAMVFTNKMILKKASNTAALHIIDFGINYGFQWPMFIQQLASRACGPPKLRITGIDRPQPGFRPSERVEETGRRLASYCERFGVPFHYKAIALQKWETLTVEDLKLVEGESLAVSCLFQSNDLLDETAVVDRPVGDSPRDVVLRLIRKMNPEIFVHSTSNGGFSVPFFVTRFREALYYYSSLFDSFEATLPRDSPERLNFEQEFYGREAINVIACEGPGRVVRPETYKKWHERHIRAGFKPHPVDPEVMKKLKAKTEAGFHKDFVFDKDGNWMLQGWKGRIIYASSCWTPA